MRWLLLIPFAAALTAQPADLAAIAQEPNLDRRVDRFANAATKALDRARDEFAKDQYEAGRASVAEVPKIIEAAAESLRAAGRDPRRNSRPFKRLEVRIQPLSRRLKAMARDSSVEDRPYIEKAHQRLEEINDEIVNGMFKK
jgi:hypothetical protein